VAHEEPAGGLQALALPRLDGFAAEGEPDADRLVEQGDPPLLGRVVDRQLDRKSVV
jgi:hypothetical protein